VSDILKGILIITEGFDRVKETFCCHEERHYESYADFTGLAKHTF
jgi:hypothetical protein